MQQLAPIAAATAHNHQRFTGEAPRVAFLSFSTRGSASHPKVDKVRAATGLFRAAHPEWCCDGDLQLVAAVVHVVASRKALDSELAERPGGISAYAPLLLGLRKPFLDLSLGGCGGRGAAGEYDIVVRRESYCSHIDSETCDDGMMFRFVSEDYHRG